MRSVFFLHVLLLAALMSQWSILRPSPAGSLPGSSLSMRKRPGGGSGQAYVDQIQVLKFILVGVLQLNCGGRIAGDF